MSGDGSGKDVLSEFSMAKGVGQKPCREKRLEEETSALAAAYAIAYGLRMRTTSYSEFRRNLATMIDRVNDDHEPLIVTRDGGKSAAVVISLEDFASLEETLHLLRSPRNSERLLEAVEALDRGEGAERTLAE